MRKGKEENRKPGRLTDFEILSKLGSGSFGIVYKVRNRTEDLICVMKQIDIAKMNKLQREEALNEAKILSSLSSPYIVGYHESFIENEKLCIIMEYCENGDLSQLLRQRRGKHLDEPTVWKYLIEICMALQYLHGRKILHRDIKTMNVFLSKGFHVKLGDLGVAKVLSQTANFAHTMVGTPYYLSPELCQEKPYNEKSDIWSLGCVLYEMCTLKHPFESRNQAALIMKIIQGRYDPLPSTYSKEIIEIIVNCLQKDYKKRPTVSELLSYPSLQKKAKELKIEIEPAQEKPAEPEKKPAEPEKKPAEPEIKKVLPPPASQKNLREREKKPPAQRKPLLYKRPVSKPLPVVSPAFQPAAPPPMAQRCRTPAEINSKGKPKRVRNGAPHGLGRRAQQAKKPVKSPTPEQKKEQPLTPRKPEIIEAEKREVANLPDVVGVKVIPEENIPCKVTQNAASGTKDPDKFMRQMMGKDYSILIKGESEKVKAEQDQNIHIDSFVVNKENKKEEPPKPILSIEDEKNLFTVVEEKLEKEEDEYNSNSDDDIQNDSEDSFDSEDEEEVQGRVSEIINVKENEDMNGGDFMRGMKKRYNDFTEEEKEVCVKNFDNKEEVESEGIKEKEAEYTKQLAAFEKHKAKLSSRIPPYIIEKFCKMVKEDKQLSPEDEDMLQNWVDQEDNMDFLLLLEEQIKLCVLLKEINT